MKHEKDWIEWTSPEDFPTCGTTISAAKLGICNVIETKIMQEHDATRRFVKVAFFPVVSAAATLGSIKSTKKAAQSRINGCKPKRKKG